MPAAWLFTGTFTGVLLGYAFFVVLGHTLTPADLGAVGSLINLSTVLAVPGLGLQLTTARRTSTDPTDAPPRPLLTAATWCAAPPALALTATAPLTAPLLHVPTTAVLLVAATTAPLTVVAAATGRLQGLEAFTRVALIALLTGITKITAALAGAMLGLGVTGITAWYCAGWVVLAAAAVHLAWAGPPTGTHGTHGTHGTRDGTDARARARAREGLTAAVPAAGLLVLSSLDLLLARHHLTPGASGTYTVGSLFTKVTFWGPQFLATLYYPAMARPHERRTAVRRALGLTATSGAAAVLATATLGHPLVAIAAGPRYTDTLGPLAWAFTALGAALAVAQVLVYADLAAGGRRTAPAVWVAVAAVAVGVGVRHATVADVVGVALVVVAALVGAALVLVRP